MSLRRAVLVPLVLSLAMLGQPPAHSTVFTGACALTLSFSFSPPIATVSTKPVSYDITASAARDLDPLTPGAEPCAVDTDALGPFRTTTASGSGTATSWTCEDAVGSGSWNQSWSPDPPSVAGFQTIAGTWGNWVMAFNNAALNFSGVMDLTVDPSDATKLSQCELTGISSLRMTGVMHFQDPTL